MSICPQATTHNKAHAPLGLKGGGLATVGITEIKAATALRVGKRGARSLATSHSRASGNHSHGMANWFSHHWMVNWFKLTCQLYMIGTSYLKP